MAQKQELVYTVTVLWHGHRLYREFHTPEARALFVDNFERADPVWGPIKKAYHYDIHVKENPLADIADLVERACQWA